jgi:FimV-like protein
MNNDKDNAIKVLNNIIKENSSREHVEQAKKLLDEINDL